MAGYLTTEITTAPNDTQMLRPLRVPNHEIERLYRAEVVGRFAGVAGGRGRLTALQGALVKGDEAGLSEMLGDIARDAASSFDLVSEGACHMLLLGLLFGTGGYADPTSNREAGRGRYDIRIEPVAAAPGAYVASRERPLVTVEVKYLRDASDEQLSDAARVVLAQIAERGYDEGPLPAVACGRLRWGVAFSGKRVVAACERA